MNHAQDPASIPAVRYIEQIVI